MTEAHAQSPNPNGTCPHGTKMRRGCLDCADSALAVHSVKTWYAPKQLPGIQRVYFGRCHERPNEVIDHRFHGCAHWHAETEIVCVAPCLSAVEEDDVPSVAILHEYAHFLVGCDVSGDSIVVAHGRKWRDKFCDLLDLHGWERPEHINAHTGGCSQTFSMRAPSDDDVATCQFEIDAYAMIWNIFESESRLRNSTPEASIEDFMERYAARETSDRTHRAFGSRAPSAGLVSVPVSLTLTQSTVDSFLSATAEDGLDPQVLVQRYMEQAAYTL